MAKQQVTTETESNNHTEKLKLQSVFFTEIYFFSSQHKYRSTIKLSKILDC